MSEFRYERDDDGIVTVTMDVDWSLDGKLTEAVARLEREGVSGVVIALKGGGAGKEESVTGLPTGTVAERQVVFDRLSSFKETLRRLESLGKPVVAVIDGAALGRGYEVCLAAHYRIALNGAGAEIGLPQVVQGLIPGAGGTVRLVRLLGLEKALPLLMEGVQLTPEKALEAGLVDELATDRADLAVKARKWIKGHGAFQQPWDQKSYRIPGGTPASPNVAQMIFVAPAILRKKQKGPQPAPEAMLAAAVEGAQVDLESALRIESRYFIELLSK